MKPINFRLDLLPLKDRIYRLGLRITLNRQEAEDLTQDTLLRVWSKRNELSTVENLEAYCLTICRNLALDRTARKESETLSLEYEELDKPDTSAPPDERLEREEKLRQVHKIFATLPEKQRTALQLRDIEEKSYSEAAAIMNIGEDDFKVTLHRARKAVREQYNKIERHGL